MPATDAPTSPRGTLGAGGMSSWGGALDQMEHVPDLTWPTSVRTYGRMRHDPTLSSVLSAYRLPILSARWEIDPRGASPAMVQACADSLGLPVRGQPEEPGPVRRRGVQWLAHLRSALGMLTFGHAAFEPVFDVSSGRALLASLGERLPLSIAEIDVTDQGELKSISQFGDANRLNPPPIPGDRLLWYALDREGAAWTGSSMLRQAFGSWMLKQDALRAAGTAVRRFAVGTPSVEWDPGVQPTAAQHAAAQAVASNVRGGDSSGAAMPPGAHLRIKGVEGTYPDALPLIQYHDQQMARGALASMLDLGNTSNGSRALGQSFAELLGLAQQGVADQLAETATQLCVRITDYNEGEGSPAPAVAIGVISEDEQALAQSIAGLVSAGAVTVDDDLEDWLRQAFRAPKRVADPGRTEALAKRRDVAETIQKIYLGVGTVLSSDEAREIANAAGAELAVPGPDFGPSGLLRGQPVPTGDVPVVARRQVRAETLAPNDGYTPAPAPTPGNRALTPQETAAGVDPQAVDDAHTEVLAALLAAWLLLREDQQSSLLAQIAAAGSVAALAVLTLDTTPAAEVLGAAMLEAADRGVQLAVAEAAHQGVTIAAPAVEVARVQDRAAALAAVMGQSTATGAAREAVRLAGDGATGQEIADGVTAYFASITGAVDDSQLSGAVQTGIGEGRATVFAAAETQGLPVTFYASEILDAATCRQAPKDPVTRCAEVDGRQYASLDAAMRDYPTGQYRSCLGRWRCRGMIYAAFMGPMEES